jgi:hypothetical protein
LLIPIASLLYFPTLITVVYQLLATPDIDLNLQGNDRRMPLSYAAGEENLEVIQALFGTPGIELYLRDCWYHRVILHAVKG